MRLPDGKMTSDGGDGMLKKFLVIMAIVLGLGAMIVGGAFYIRGKKNTPLKGPSVAELQKWQVPLPQITTNTSNGGIVQATLTIQAIGGKSAKDVQTDASVLLNSINMVIHNDPSNEFLSKAGLITFQKQVLQAIHTDLPKNEVQSVYITQIIEQG